MSYSFQDDLYGMMQVKAGYRPGDYFINNYHLMLFQRLQTDDQEYRGDDKLFHILLIDSTKVFSLPINKNHWRHTQRIKSPTAA